MTSFDPAIPRDAPHAADDAAPPAPSRSRRVQAWLVAAQLLVLAALVPWLGLTWFAWSVVGTEGDWRGWALLAAATAYGPAMLLAMRAGWRRWRRGRGVAAVNWSALAVLMALPPLVYLAGVVVPAAGGGRTAACCPGAPPAVTFRGETARQAAA